MFRERGMEVAIVGPGDRIELKPITIGRNVGTEVEVLTGLALSERLVNSPPDSLATGDVVRIAAPAAAANTERPTPPGEEARRAGAEAALSGCAVPAAAVATLV